MKPLIAILFLICTTAFVACEDGVEGVENEATGDEEIDESEENESLEGDEPQDNDEDEPGDDEIEESEEDEFLELLNDRLGDKIEGLIEDELEKLMNEKPDGDDTESSESDFSESIDWSMIDFEDSGEEEIEESEYEESDEEEDWLLYKLTHHLSYGPNEESRRRDVYLHNRKMIREHNRMYEHGETSFKLDENDFTNKESGELIVWEYEQDLDEPILRQGFTLDLRTNPLPHTVDWRSMGAVTRVKNQMWCDCSWAFAIVGAVEGLLYLQSGTLKALSEQYLIDCSCGEPCCGGTSEELAYAFIAANGIPLETKYAYRGEAIGCCKYNLEMLTYIINGFQTVPPGDEEALMYAVADVGPVATKICLCTKLLHYKEGIFDDPSCDCEPTQGVLIVGYGTHKGMDYWLVKNSWGTSWGEDGYIRIARNKGNMLRIADRATYPV